MGFGGLFGDAGNSQAQASGAAYSQSVPGSAYSDPQPATPPSGRRVVALVLIFLVILAIGAWYFVTNQASVLPVPNATPIPTVLVTNATATPIVLVTPTVPADTGEFFPTPIPAPLVSSNGSLSAFSPRETSLLAIAGLAGALGAQSGVPLKYSVSLQTGPPVQSMAQNWTLNVSNRAVYWDSVIPSANSRIGFEYHPQGAKTPETAKNWSCPAKEKNLTNCSHAASLELVKRTANGMVAVAEGRVFQKTGVADVLLRAFEDGQDPKARFLGVHGTGATQCVAYEAGERRACFNGQGWLVEYSQPGLSWTLQIPQ